MTILLFILFILFYINYKLNNKNFIAPSCIFTASFLFSSLWAKLFEKKWMFELHSKTFYVIVGGIVVFSITTAVISIFTKKNLNNKCVINKIEVEKIKTIFFIIFEILVIFITLYEIVSLTGGSFSNISSSIYKFRIANTFSTHYISLPKIVGISRTVVNALGYFYAYILINNYLFDRKIDKLALVVFLLSMFSDLATGARTGVINHILSSVCCFFVMHRKTAQKEYKLDFKSMFKTVLFFVVLLFVFQVSANLIGRENKSNISGFESLSIYLGAPIRNLDYYLLHNSGAVSKIFGEQSFIYIHNWLSLKFRFIDEPIILNLPFLYFNGISFGNVYTTFYQFIYDFGILGIIPMTFIMAFLSQLFYVKSFNKKSSDNVSINILIYSYMFNAIILSFFSNRFFEQIFNKSFIELIIIWIVLNYFCIKLKLNK